MTETPRKPTITLKDGTVLNVREAASVLDRLRVAESICPNEFHTLLAMARGQYNDANPEHFPKLLTFGFLEKDKTSIRPIVRTILLQCYELTEEGPVLKPLKLLDACDKETARWAEREIEKAYESLLPRHRGKEK